MNIKKLISGIALIAAISLVPTNLFADESANASDATQVTVSNDVVAPTSTPVTISDADLAPSKVTGVNQLRWYDLDEKVEITWNTQSGVDGYEIQFLDKKGNLLYETTSQSNTAVYNDVLNRNVYKARVRAYKVVDKYDRFNERTLYGEWSKKALLFKQPQVNSVNMEDRLDKNGEVVGTQMVLNWESVPGAKKYKVYVSTDPHKGYKLVAMTRKTSATVKYLKNDYSAGKKDFKKNKTYYVYIAGASKSFYGLRYDTGLNYIYIVSPNGTIKRDYYSK